MRTGKYTFQEFVTGELQFVIPEYQRNYSWQENHLKDLWRDLNENLDKKHFFGTILVRESDENGDPYRDEYEVIDGQQRLTSTLILLNELAKYGTEYDIDQFERNIRKRYLVDEGGYKLALQEDDDDFYKEFILEGVIDESGTGQRTLEAANEEKDSPSRRKLWKAKKYFSEEAFPDKLSTLSEGQAERYCLDLFEKVKELDLMVYNVESRQEAVRIFQTINDRGKGLTDLEKTKSFLMHQLYLSIPEESEQLLDTQIEKVQTDFGNIYGYYDEINQTEIGDNIGEDDVQRYHFIIWDKDWRTGYEQRYYQDHLGYLKKIYREMAISPEGEEITNYTQELRKSYLVLKQIVEADIDNSDEINEKLEQLFNIGRLGNFYPLLIAAWLQNMNGTISDGDFYDLVEAIENFVVRVYSIGQKAANTGRTKIYRTARKLHQSQQEDPADITPINIKEATSSVQEYANNYLPNSKLKGLLYGEKVYKYYTDSNRTDELRYLLYFQEKALEDELEEIPLDDISRVVKNPDDADYSIEHIWPQDNSRIELTKEEEGRYDEYKHRLGNLALMKGDWNSEQQNSPFEDKKSAYKDSKIRMLNKVAEYDEWGFEQIEQRERKMLNVIDQTWPDPHSDNSLVELIDSEKSTLLEF